MSALLQQLALLVTAAGLLLGALVALASRRPRDGLAVVLDFVLAAGLLRLALLDSWTAIASVTLVVVVRRLAVTGLRQAAGAGAPRRRGARGP